MRKIDLLKMTPIPEWKKNVEIAKAKIIAESLPPSKFPAIWTELKDNLKKISHGKCWYCESRQIRSDNAVDHFRPKSLYPWLAYDPSNFRYTCTFCNSIRRDSATDETAGKGNNFPLFLESGRAKDENAFIQDEQCVLIDPCHGSEAGLIDFDENGEACAKYKDNAYKNERAEKSIHYYHLNHSELVEQRRKLALELQELIKEADRYYQKIEQGKIEMQDAFCNHTNKIMRKLEESAELSVFAKRIVQGYKNKDWIDDLLQCA